MLISDWSTDVCSSDLLPPKRPPVKQPAESRGPNSNVIAAIVFYLFATVVIASAMMTIASRNPVHSVLWPILAFFNAAGLMLLVGAAFIAMLLVIVYVGEVAVLFLFVVMMLDIAFADLRAGFAQSPTFGQLLARRSEERRGGQEGVSR